MKKFYITTAIDYPSERPHLGHALEKIQADAIARYKRLQGFDVYFSTGTDEHGLKIQRYAQKANKAPQEFVDEMSRYFRDLCKVLNISNDDFIRTTEKRHIKVVQGIFKKIYEKGDIYKGKYKGLYCVECESYYLPKDSEDGKCPVHHKPLEVIEEETYFFRMSKYQKELFEYIRENKNFIVPESKRNEILNRLKGPLQDLSISRKMVEWGIPLPADEKVTLFVWIDALMNYLSTIDYPGKKFQKFWPADIHLIGKDIIWHHSVIWGSWLMSAGLPLPKTILVHGFLTIDGQKMSKSLGNVVDPIYLVKKYGADVLRFYLLKEMPLGSDADFSISRLEEVYNGDLANGLGNLVARVLAMAEKYFEGKVPLVDKKVFDMVKFKGERLEASPWVKYSKENQPEDRDFKELVGDVWASYKDGFEKLQLDKTLDQAWQFSRLLDGYIQDWEPFKLIKIDKAKTAGVIYNLLESLRHIAWLIRPFLPETSDKIFAQLGILDEEKKKKLEEAEKWGGLKANTKIKKGKLLFPRI